MTNHIAMDKLRRKNRFIKPIDKEAEEIEDNATEEYIYRDQRIDMVDKAASTYGEKNYKIYLMRVKEGLSYKEIAARINSTPDKVKALFGKIKKRLILYFNKDS